MKDNLFISNDILNEALLKYQIERINAEYPSIQDWNKQFKPNKHTEKKMEKLIRMEKKPYFILINSIGKRAACIIIALLITMATTVFSVKALKEPFIHFIIETYEKFSTIIFISSESSNGESSVLIEYFEPSYIPEGYTKTYEEKLTLSYFCEYTNESGNVLIYEQNSIQNAQTGIDTENAIVEKIYINGLEGLSFENKFLHNIVFSNKQYSFFVSGNISKSELIKVAESIETLNIVTK